MIQFYLHDCYKANDTFHFLFMNYHKVLLDGEWLHGNFQGEKVCDDQSLVGGGGGVGNTTKN